MRSRLLLVMLVVMTATIPLAVTAQNDTEAETNETETTSMPIDPELMTEANGTETPQTNNSGTVPIEPIDRLTAIESTRIKDGRMVLVIQSDVVQRVVLTDAGAVWKGGKIPQRDFTLQPGSNRLSIPVTEVSGRVAVTIATRRVLYSTVIVTSDPLIGGPFDRGDVQQAALAGLAAGVGVTALIAFKRVRGTSDVPERVL